MCLQGPGITSRMTRTRSSTGIVWQFESVDRRKVVSSLLVRRSISSGTFSFANHFWGLVSFYLNHLFFQGQQASTSVTPKIRAMQSAEWRPYSARNSRRACSIGYIDMHDQSVSMGYADQSHSLGPLHSHCIL